MTSDRRGDTGCHQALGVTREHVYSEDRKAYRPAGNTVKSYLAAGIEEPRYAKRVSPSKLDAHAENCPPGSKWRSRNRETTAQSPADPHNNVKRLKNDRLKGNRQLIRAYPQPSQMTFRPRKGVEWFIPFRIEQCHPISIQNEVKRR